MAAENLYIEDIDWSLIDPEKFEKLIYFLLDSIGMKNIWFFLSRKTFQIKSWYIMSANFFLGHCFYGSPCIF